MYPCVWISEAREADIERPATYVTFLVGFDGCGVLIKIGAEKLMHVRSKLAMPCNTKHVSIGRNVLAKNGAGCAGDFVNGVAAGLSLLNASINLRTIRFDRSGIAAECGKSGQRK